MTRLVQTLYTWGGVDIGDKKTVHIERGRISGQGVPHHATFQAGLSEAKKRTQDSIREWDQGERGWRHAVEQGRLDEALRQIEEVLDSNPSSRWSSDLGRHTVAFHGLQVAGLMGTADRQKINRLAHESLTGKPGGWDNYVNMTLGFITGDREKFDRCVSGLDTPPTPAERAMISNFGTKSYEETLREAEVARKSGK